IAIVLALFLLALGLRLYRLDDWTFGIFGDEGYSGLCALNILNGQNVSLFSPQLKVDFSFSCFAVAGTMQVFGTGIVGLKMFQVLTGSLMLIPFYLLMR